MRMPVYEPRMDMDVRVRLAQRIVGAVGMPVVRVVDVPMLVQQRLVLMFVLVALREMQIEAERHQDAGDGEL